jgi:hypothetical protein
MVKAAPFVAAGALVVAVMAIAVSGPAATAPAANCKSKTNQYVACTDRFKAKTVRKRGADVFAKIGDIKGETEDKRRRKPRLRGK